MSCFEGKRLRGLFLQATMAARDLETKTAPLTIKDKRTLMQEIERAHQFQDDCKRDVTEHARWCPECRLKTNETKRPTPIR
jgi:hypothetical protein